MVSELGRLEAAAADDFGVFGVIPISLASGTRPAK